MWIPPTTGRLIVILLQTAIEETPPSVYWSVAIIFSFVLNLCLMLVFDSVIKCFVFIVYSVCDIVVIVYSFFLFILPV